MPHTHSDACYTTREVCGKTQHSHDANCQARGCSQREHWHDSTCSRRDLSCGKIES